MATTTHGSSSVRSETRPETVSEAGRISSTHPVRRRWRTSTRSSSRDAWYALVPDQAHAIVTDGLGTFGMADYVTAASTPDGTLAIAYVPSNRTITVDMSRFSGPVTARWYDPCAGTFASISATSFPNAGSQQFTPPGANADGTDDWVLALEVH